MQAASLFLRRWAAIFSAVGLSGVVVIMMQSGDSDIFYELMGE
jgi:hypothetical protein